MSRKLTMGLLLLASLTSCGKSLPKLTDAQKSDLKTSLSGVAKALRSNTSGAGIGRDSFVQPGSGLDNSALLANFSSRMNSCLHEGTQPYSIQALASVNVSYKISGPQCPLLLSLSAKTDGKTAKIRADYKLQDPEFLSLMGEIDQAKLDGEVTLDQNSPGFDLKGSFHGPKFGEAGFSVSTQVSIKENTEKTVVRVDFPEYSAKLTYSRDGFEEKFILNGEEMTKAQFLEFFGEFLHMVPRY